MHIRLLVLVSLVLSLQPCFSKTAASGWEEDETEQKADTSQQNQEAQQPAVLEPALPQDPIYSDTMNSQSPTVAVQKPSKKNWFLNPDPVPWISDAGKALKNGAKNVGRAAGATAEGTKSVLTSPLFWGTTAAAGAITGMYFLNKGRPAAGVANPDVEWVNYPHVNAAGQYVTGYWRTKSNGLLMDNFSTKGNYNPYTGQWGTVNPY